MAEKDVEQKEISNLIERIAGTLDDAYGAIPRGMEDKNLKIAEEIYTITSYELNLTKYLKNND